jgi:hypothetical protein
VHGYTDIRKPPRIDPKYVEIGWRIVIGYDLEDWKELNGVIAARIKTLRQNCPSVWVRQARRCGGWRESEEFYKADGTLTWI